MKIRLFAVLLVVLLTLSACTVGAQSPASTPVETTQTNLQTQPQEQTQPASDLITREQAIAIALEHAGFTENQVRQLWAEYDVDHGVKLYEVDFKNENLEYEYDIHAETGEILNWKTEVDD